MGDGPLPKAHGTFTFASTIGRVLSLSGYGPFRIRKGIGFGGHRCRSVEYRKAAMVTYLCRDDTPDDQMGAERAEMLDLYEQCLTAKGYRVERDERSLTVYPKDTAK